MLDVVGAINEQDDYEKNRNYWKYLKAKLKKEGSQLGSALPSSDSQPPTVKKRLANVIDSEDVAELAKHFPNSKAAKFLDWLTYSDNTIDGQSKKKAYTFWQSNLVGDKDIR